MPDRSTKRTQSRILGLGFEFAAILIVCALLGLWMDRRYATAPWGAAAGAVIGLTGGLYYFIRAARKSWTASDRPPSTGQDREADR